LWTPLLYGPNKFCITWTTPSAGGAPAGRIGLKSKTPHTVAGDCHIAEPQQYIIAIFKGDLLAAHTESDEPLRPGSDILY